MTTNELAANDPLNTENPQQENDQPIPGVNPPTNTTNGLLMDYDELAAAEGEEPTAAEPEITVGLTGGQGKGDPGGIDISQYTGPEAKASSQFDDPEAAYGTGPGNGVNQSGEAEGAEWENPEPEGDSV